MMSDSSQPIGAPSSTRSCVSCGRTIDWNANVCPYCGHDYRMAMMPQQPVKKGAMPIVGGVLILIAGILAIGMGALYLTLDVNDIEDYGVTLPPDMSAQDLADFMDVCGGILVVFGLLAIIGGVFGIMRKHFGFAIVGGIFGLIGIGFIIGALLGLIGLILVAVSRKDFD